MTQESRAIEIAALRASCEAALDRSEVEVHPITPENLS